MLRVVVCPPCYDPAPALPEDGEVLDASRASSLSGITSEVGSEERLVLRHIDVPAAHEWVGCSDEHPLRVMRSKVHNVLSALMRRVRKAWLLVHSQVFLDFIPSRLHRRVEVEFVRSDRGSGDELASWPPHGVCPAVEGLRAEEMERNVRAFVRRTGSAVLGRIARWDVRRVRLEYLSATEILRGLCPDLRRFSLGTRLLDALEAAGVLTSRNSGYRMFSWSPAVVSGRTSEIVMDLVERVVEVEGELLDAASPRERAGASGAVRRPGDRE
jgi:hypothetical protein